MEASERWGTLFSDSQSLLDKMASEALQDFEDGTGWPVDELGHH